MIQILAITILAAIFRITGILFLAYAFDWSFVQGMLVFFALELLELKFSVKI